MTLTEAEQARDEAIARVEQHTKLTWRVEAEQVIADLASGPEDFTSDDVWRELDARGVSLPHDNRALGAVMRSMARRQWIEKTGEYRPSERASTHASPKAVWRGL